LVAGRNKEVSATEKMLAESVPSSSSKLDRQAKKTKAAGVHAEGGGGAPSAREVVEGRISKEASKLAMISTTRTAAGLPERVPKEKAFGKVRRRWRRAAEERRRRHALRLRRGLRTHAGDFVRRGLLAAHLPGRLHRRQGDPGPKPEDARRGQKPAARGAETRARVRASSLLSRSLSFSLARGWILIQPPAVVQYCICPHPFEVGVYDLWVLRGCGDATRGAGMCPARTRSTSRGSARSTCPPSTWRRSSDR
jgi:hypothetical protein